MIPPKKFYVGGEQCFFVDKEGNLYASGKNENGQLNVGDIYSSKIPKKINLSSGEELKSICCRNSEHVLLFTKSGNVYGCGKNEANCIGGKKDKERVTNFSKISFFEKNNIKAKSVFTGKYTSFVISEDDKLYVFGMNNYCQLGFDSQRNDVMIPKELPTSFLEKGEKIIDIRGGGYHTNLLTSSNNVYSAGYGNKEPTKFTKIDFFSSKNIKIVQIDCGWQHSLFLSDKNIAYSTGFGKYGQLGLNSTEKQEIPQEINLKNVQKVECGSYYSFFVTKNEKKIELYSCGANREFQLGLRHNNDVLKPEISKYGYYNFIDVFCANSTTYFIDKLGQIFSCGRNSEYQCSIGTYKSPIKSPEWIRNLKISIQ